MTAAGDMTSGRSQLPIGLNAEYSIDGVQYRQETIDVSRFARIDQVNVKRLHGSATKNRRQTTHEYAERNRHDEQQKKQHHVMCR